MVEKAPLEVFYSPQSSKLYQMACISSHWDVGLGVELGGFVTHYLIPVGGSSWHLDF